MGKRKGEILSLTALLFVFMLTTLFFYMVYNMHYDSASDDFTGFTVFDYQSEPGMPTSSSLGSLPDELDEWANANRAVYSTKAFLRQVSLPLTMRAGSIKLGEYRLTGRRPKPLLSKKETII